MVEYGYDKYVFFSKVPGVQTYPSIKTMCNPNKPIRLICRIDKQPFEGWFDSYGRKILPETHGTKMQVEDQGIYQVLLINNVTARDGGTYTCQGAFDSAEVNLNVNRKYITRWPLKVGWNAFPFWTTSSCFFFFFFLSFLFLFPSFFPFFFFFEETHQCEFNTDKESYFK